MRCHAGEEGNHSGVLSGANVLGVDIGPESEAMCQTSSLSFNWKEMIYPGYPKLKRDGRSFKKTNVKRSPLSTTIVFQYN